MTNRRRRRARHKAHKARARRTRELLDVMLACFDLQYELHSITSRRIAFAEQWITENVKP